MRDEETERGTSNFFGRTEQVPPGFKVSMNMWQLMANVEYDVGLGDSFVLRPYAGLGLNHLDQEACSQGCISPSVNNFAMGFGVQPILRLGPAILLADARFNVIFDNEALTSLMFGGGAGVNF